MVRNARLSHNVAANWRRARVRELPGTDETDNKLENTAVFIIAEMRIIVDIRKKTWQLYCLSNNLFQ